MLEIKVNDQLSLRQLLPADAPLVYDQIDTSRKTLRRFLPWVDYNVKEDHSLRFIELMLRKADEQDAIAFGMFQRDALCGVMDLHGWDHSLQKAEIGYWLGEAFRGQGIALECCRALMKFAFDELHLNKIEIRFALQNERSSKIPIRLGFAKEGVLRHSAKLHGQLVDMVVMGMLKKDFKV
ncbi:ribosomal-protein-serine acetyltransferase [Chitinophaga costaii]|uniref:Ribosomal-protein-serine acetyltransferase n=1 Tax=Chitinophaga costaii TaxID=1335309 RepID=A0A1C4AK85_9BACT|nr:GNAT family protein [Chitinophaga costaii]PUZ26635.1 N-acetyltransferase [Chitinophaga costaii]SCB94876.1 ribosomal-protein-serine acetyltransferase [Chitinophaga costaii]